MLEKNRNVNNLIFGLLLIFVIFPSCKNDEDGHDEEPFPSCTASDICLSIFSCGENISITWDQCINHYPDSATANCVDWNGYMICQCDCLSLTCDEMGACGSNCSTKYCGPPTGSE
jgi:hypothetical protein